MPKHSEGVLRPKGQTAPVNVDDLLYQAMGDPAILTPELAATIEKVLDRVAHEYHVQGRQPQRGDARRRAQKEQNTMT
jgi:hypothetical protein